jgi:ATP-binding cassette subfamily F protein 3
MLDIMDLTYRVAGRTLIDHAGAQIPDGHHVGLVGRNGTGKSTLFRLIAGEIEPDGGEIRLPRAAKLGMVAQEEPAGAATPLELVLAGDAERARLLSAAEEGSDPHALADIHARLADLQAHAAPARAAVILAGLGFDHAAQNRPISSFSGGWRMRVTLAAALFGEPDLLLLDEPTNHLDIEAALWLEGFLKSYPKTLLVVSHDRDFLNSIATGILHLEHCALTFYSGDYDNFERTRRERLAQTEAMRAKQEAHRKHMQAFVDRFRAQATKARQAQSRLKALARMTPIAAVLRDPVVTFQFPEPSPLAPPLIALDEAAVGYEPGRPVLRHLDLRIDPDDRIALLGANGNGKSTLAKLIAGRLAPQAGARHAPSKLKVGFFAQHQVEELDLDATPLILMQRLMGEKAREQSVRAALARFGFGQERAQTRVAALSGGEKARLTLALVTHDAPHLLILDEPTNHLDIEAREALIEGLSDYSGAVILVSHDRHLVETIADRLWLVAGGTARIYEDDIEEYRRQVLAGAFAEPRAKAAARASAPKAAAARPAGGRANALRQAELLVEKRTAEKARLDRELADPALYRGDKQRLDALLAKHAEASAALEAAEARWIALAEAADGAKRAG